jgi:putative membrane protein
MNLTSIERVLLGVNVAIIVGFGWYYLDALNYEFLAYVASIAVITVVLFSTLRWTKFPSSVLLGITVWAFLHMLGGSFMTSDGVLYAYRIYPFFDGGGDFYVLKMDQVIHAFLYGVVGLMFLHTLQVILGVTKPWWLVGCVAIFAAAGFSIVNEIIEFWAAMNIPGNGVGGYENTVLDLIFNLCGALLAVVGALLMQRWKQ